MRQFFNELDVFTQVGDYAWIRVNGTITILAFMYNSSNFALYSSDVNLDGSTRPRRDEIITRFPFLADYTSSWILSEGLSLRGALQDCNFTRENRSEIINEPIPILEPEASTEELKPLSSKYLSLNYKQDTMYVGMHGWHSHHGCRLNEPVKAWKKHRVGVELEVEFKDRDKRKEFTEIPSNWFYCERDGSLGDGDYGEGYGCEIITIPLLPSDAKNDKFWEVLTSELSGRAASWDTNGRCGLHIHLSRSVTGKNAEEQSETLGKLLYLYHHFVKDTRFNTKLYGRARGYHDHDGKSREGDAASLLGGDSLRNKVVSDKVKKAMLDKSYSGYYDNDYRYFDINLQNEHTIEFRRGKGSINPKRIAMVVEYCELMCVYARQTPWQQIDFNDFIAYLKGVGSDGIKEIISSTVF